MQLRSYVPTEAPASPNLMETTTSVTAQMDSTEKSVTMPVCHSLSPAGFLTAPNLGESYLGGGGGVGKWK